MTILDVTSCLSLSHQSRDLVVGQIGRGLLRGESSIVGEGTRRSASLDDMLGSGVQSWTLGKRVKLVLLVSSGPAWTWCLVKSHPHVLKDSVAVHTHAQYLTRLRTEVFLGDVSVSIGLASPKRNDGAAINAKGEMESKCRYEGF